MRRLFGFLFLSLAALVCNAEVIAYVDADGDDMVGRQMAFKLKEQIRKSASMRLADAKNEANMTIYLSTINPDDNPSQTRTAYSTVLTMKVKDYDICLHNSIGICGSSRTDDCATNVLVMIDMLVSQLRKSIKESNASGK